MKVKIRKNEEGAICDRLEGGEEDGEEDSEEDGDGDSQDDEESEEPAAKKTKSS